MSRRVVETERETAGKKRHDPERASVRRLLNPAAVAIVGASDRRFFPGFRRLIDHGPRVYLVNPKHPTVFGKPTVPSLADIPEPLDLIFSLVGPDLSIEVVAHAARLNAGGVVVFASDFDHSSGGSSARLREAAGRMPLLGPNCNGIINVRSNAYVTTAPIGEIRPGGVAFISHSGGFLAEMASGAAERRFGLSHLIAAGNELVTDAVDYLEELIEDENVRVIALAIEAIRRPDAFFAAMVRARKVGKPIVALKLGRSARARDMVLSHTGAIAGQPWVYDAAFRQAGVIAARDFSDLVDIAAAFEQVPDRFRKPMTNVAVIATSGGRVELASDICEQEGVSLHDMPSARPGLSEILEEAGVTLSDDASLNPVDLGGQAAFRTDIVAKSVRHYAMLDGTDAVLFVHSLSGGKDEALISGIAAGAKESATPIMVASVDNAAIAPWADGYLAEGVALGRGLRSAIRGLKAVSDFSAAQARPRSLADTQVFAEVAAPGPFLKTPAGPMLTFSKAMELLRGAGIPIAPFQMIVAGEIYSAPPEFAGPYVVKLADVPHRTEISAVDFDVLGDAIPDSIRRLRKLAGTLGLPADIVIQPRLAAQGEVYLGAQVDGDLGPMVFCGLGGTFVELMGDMTARRIPFDQTEALRMLHELNPKILAGFRGAPPWDLPSLAATATALGALTAACGTWLASLDINPLIYSGGKFVAVDALVIGNVER